MRWQPQQPQQMYVQQQPQQQIYAPQQQQQPGYDRIESHHPQDAGQFTRMAPSAAPPMQQQHQGDHLPPAAAATGISNFPMAVPEQDGFLSAGPMAQHRVIKKEGRAAASASEFRVPGDSFESRGDGACHSSAAADTASDDSQGVGIGTDMTSQERVGHASHLAAQMPPARGQHNLNAESIVDVNTAALEAVGSSCGGLLGTGRVADHTTLQKVLNAGGDAVGTAAVQQQACPHILPPLSSWNSIAESVANEANPVHEPSTLQAAPGTPLAVPQIGTVCTTASSQSVLHLPLLPSPVPLGAAILAAGGSTQVQVSGSTGSTCTTSSNIVKQAAIVGQGAELAAANASVCMPQ